MPNNLTLLLITASSLVIYLSGNTISISLVVNTTSPTVLTSSFRKSMKAISVSFGTFFILAIL